MEKKLFKVFNLQHTTGFFLMFSRRFPVNFAKFLRTFFLQNTFGSCFCTYQFQSHFQRLLYIAFQASSIFPRTQTNNSSLVPVLPAEIAYRDVIVIACRDLEHTTTVPQYYCILTISYLYHNIILNYLSYYYSIFSCLPCHFCIFNSYLLFLKNPS